MTIKIKLGSTLYLCPVYWVNFITQLDDKLVNADTGYTKDDGFSMEFLNAELSAYGCVFNQERGKYWLDFDSESDYAAFIMTYGA